MREVQVNTTLDRLKKSSYILNSMVKNDVKNMYRNSVLGVLWTVLNPLLNMFVMAFVFSNFFRFQPPNGVSYHAYLLTGTIVFNLMRQATDSSLRSIVDNFGMVTKVKVPYSILPLSRNICSLVTFGFSYIALIIVMLCFKVPFHWTMVMVIPMLPALMLFNLGLSFILTTLFVYFRDTCHLYTVVLTLWTYLTPIFYDIDTMELAPQIMTVMKLNPMYHFLKYFREATLYGVIPDLKSHLFIYAIGIGCFLIGLLIFKWRKKYFILHI